MTQLKAAILLFLTVLFGFLFVAQTANYLVTKNSLTKLQLEFSEAKQQAAEALAEATTKSRNQEAALAQAASQTRKDVDAQVTALTRQRDDLARRVRLSQEPSGQLRVSSWTPATTLGGTVPGGDPPLVLGTIGEEDVDEAARADTLRTHYLACVEQYSKARELMSH